jgi:hypothetical protein
MSRPRPTRTRPTHLAGLVWSGLVERRTIASERPIDWGNKVQIQTPDQTSNGVRRKEIHTPPLLLILFCRFIVVFEIYRPDEF